MVQANLPKDALWLFKRHCKDYGPMPVLPVSHPDSPVRNPEYDVTVKNGPGILEFTSRLMEAVQDFDMKEPSVCNITLKFANGVTIKGLTIDVVEVR